VAEEPGGGARPALLGWVPKLGVWAWSFVGFVVAMAIVVAALAAVSEIVLPLTFAAVLAVVFKPLVTSLGRHRLRPALAAGLVVLGLLALMALVVVATVRGVVEQTEQIGASVDAAQDEAADQTGGLGIDLASLDAARAATGEAGPMVTGGVLTQVVAGIDKLIGLASGLILGALIMFYLLKDGTRLRRSVVAAVDPRMGDELDDFSSEACRILRDYGRGRTVMSVIVSAVIGLAALLLGLPLVFSIMVVNFVGGYIPYIGAFLGGGLAVIVALGTAGSPRPRSCSWRCSPPTCCWRTSSSPRSWAAPWTSTRWWCWS
jgi:putative heme transporter